MIGKLSLALCCLIGAVACLESSEWLAFKTQHGMSYESQVEESMRRSIFEANKQRIEQFNAEESKQAGYRMGLNHLSDRTEAELRGLMGAKKPVGWVEPANSREGEDFLARVLGNRSEPIPDSVDWRHVPGRVSEVKDQGQCGSSWAFSTTGLLEGQQLKVTKGKELISLSEQQLVDCTVEYACSGSLPVIALGFIYQAGGIDSEQTYPYTDNDNTGCKYNYSNSVMTTRGPIVLPQSEEILKEVVAKYGPVSISFAINNHFIYYSGGVLKIEKCSDVATGYFAALIVGYGTDPKEGDYWLVKNAWTTDWGESGYLRIARNKNNMCEVASMAVIATF